jgi:hypothetical protein
MIYSGDRPNESAARAPSLGNQHFSSSGRAHLHQHIIAAQTKWLTKTNQQQTWFDKAVCLYGGMFFL